MQRHAELKRALEEPSEIVAIFAEIVEAGVARGEIPAQLAPRLVLTFVACAMGMSLFAAAIDGSQLEAIAETFGDLLDGKLFAAAKTRKRR
jgi:hypothetical protein